MSQGRDQKRAGRTSMSASTLLPQNAVICLRANCGHPDHTAERPLLAQSRHRNTRVSHAIGTGRGHGGSATQRAFFTQSVTALLLRLSLLQRGEREVDKGSRGSVLAAGVCSTDPHDCTEFRRTDRRGWFTGQPLHNTPCWDQEWIWIAPICPSWPDPGGLQVVSCRF